MGTFLTDLSNSVTSVSLWAELAPAAGIIGVAILFSFGYTVLRKVTKGLGKGKVRI